MIDPRPVVYVLGLLLAVLGAIMLVPMAVDYSDGNRNWLAFLECAVLTSTIGLLMSLACRNATSHAITLQQSFLLTAGIWLAVPCFGALPFIIGAPGLGFTDAYFEAMSGVTTTGATVIEGLDHLPRGMNLWRGLLQWLGGLGIVIVAMIFLPVMKVGGMQFFRSEGFDTLGKVLPRALDISSALLKVYLGLTVACAACYAIVGMTPFDSIVHALTTLSTGGFSNYDASFGAYLGAPEVVASAFMILAALPFVRYVQIMQGQARPLFLDVQVRAFLRWILAAVSLLMLYRLWNGETAPLAALRETLFNVVSVITGTGFASADITKWGPASLVAFVLIGLVGGCTSSTVCSIKVFRWLVLLSAIRVQIRRLHSPSRVQPVRLGGRVVEDEVVSSVMAFVSLFILSFGLLIIGLSLTGLASQTAITAAWTSIANVGPAWGPEVGPTGAMASFPDTAKWLMIFGMFLGRLELLSVFVLLLPRFWRA